MRGNVSEFIKRNFKHFNAATLVEASEAYVAHLSAGGKMLISLGGAMSTAELGISLAEMIRQDKVHAICCTGANLEEDVYNLVAHDLYKRVPHYRQLTPHDEIALRDSGLNRVTDTCIPEEAAIKAIEHKVFAFWQQAERENQRYFPYEFMYRLLREGDLTYQIDPADSWLLAACDKGLPIFTPGWEDSSLGNNFLAKNYSGMISNIQTYKSGLEAKASLLDWYIENDSSFSLGCYQIGGGIAGSFAFNVSSPIRKGLKIEVKPWRYFCQVSDSSSSYGSFSGLEPEGRISGGNLDQNSARFFIESDATIVAPAMFAYILQM